MRIASFILWLLLTGAFVWFLNHSQGSIPALGKLLSPSHGFWQQLEGDLPALPDAVSSVYLKDEVTVSWDENLVPHIFAKNDADLYFAQGYITASLRLWQMDFQTRAAAGRVAEVVGDVALEFDKRMRRQGMVSGAKKSFEVCMRDAHTNVAFQQYSKGVNAYINTLKEKDFPVEYKLLDMQPEAWSPMRSMLLLNYMANMLNTANNDIAYSHFVEAYSYADWDMLFGGPDDVTEPIVNAPGSWRFDPVSPAEMPTDMVRAPQDLHEPDQANPNNGSNNWAVSPTKSATGNALLANDPHLPFTLPSLWFLTHVKTPEQNTMGVTIPGAPGIVIGCNDSLAWGVTNARSDLVDWYRVVFTDGSRSHILVDSQAVAVTKIVETIPVKNQDTVYDTLYYAPFGIIADYSELSTTTNEAWAYRWLGQDASEVAVALLKLNKAKNMADYLAATDKFQSPGQNIAYADVQGNIGIRVAGNFLVRQPNEGLFLRDGTNSANQWQHFIPASHKIEQFNPERGFVSSANQLPVDTTYPYFIAAIKFESYRNRRINQVLAADTAVTVDDMKRLHVDNYNLEAAENLKYWLAALRFTDLNPEQQAVFNKLMNWNFFVHPEMEEPAYYASWRKAIFRNAWDEMIASEPEMPVPSAYRTFQLLKEKPELPWWDIQNTATNEHATQLIAHAFQEAVQELDTWQKEQESSGISLNWGNIKATRLVHLSRQMALSQENIFVGGSNSAVNTMRNDHGPSWRQVVELDPDGVRAWGIYPGGQSGNPGSAWYTNFTAPWASGKYLDLKLNFTAENARRVHKTSFKPQAQ
jgi:penicillin amidase